MAAGLLGGVPGGFNVATYINVRIGGRSRIAGIISALVVLAALLGTATILERVPWAVLAAILIRVGLGLIDWHFFRRLRHISPDFAAVMLVTIVCGLWFDFITAIVVGLVVSGLLGARRTEVLEARKPSLRAAAGPTHPGHGRHRRILRSLRGKGGRNSIARPDLGRIGSRSNADCRS